MIKVAASVNKGDDSKDKEHTAYHSTAESYITGFTESRVRVTDW
jgi:hypothetical protein